MYCHNSTTEPVQNICMIEAKLVFLTYQRLYLAQMFSIKPTNAVCLTLFPNDSLNNDSMTRHNLACVIVLLELHRQVRH
jgi:hypothetical protein